MISFSVGCEDLAERHLKVDQVDPQYRPLPELLIDHLAQCVWRCCLFPGWKHGDQHLHFGTQGTEGVSPDEAVEDPAAALTARLQQLDLHSRGGRDGISGAREQLGQFSMKEMEYGEGKYAFEGYLAAALSPGNDSIPGLFPALCRYTEEE